MTVWRWLSEDAIRPWNYRSWIFPRDPSSQRRPGGSSTSTRAGGKANCCTPATSSCAATRSPRSKPERRKPPQRTPQARRRGSAGRARVRAQRSAVLSRRAGTSAAPGSSTAAPRRTGSSRSTRSIEQFMSIEPYRKAQRVFVIVDNGSAHRGQRSIDRLQGTWPNLILVHTPVHASWVNQAEIYFSVVQRKALNPTTSPTSTPLEQHATRLRPPLRADRKAIRVEVHPPGPRPRPRQARSRHTHPTSSPPNRYVRELTSQTT